MICSKNGFPKNFLVVLLFLFSSGGDSQVTGTTQQVVAMLGDDTTLPCYLESAQDAAQLTVEWSRADLDPRFVLLRRGGNELQNEKHSMYSGRSSLSTEKLKCGDVSLKLSQVRLLDSGTYKCLVPKTNTESDIQLTVGSTSFPTIHISKTEDGVSLDCKSEGWFPEPKVLWLDSEGGVLSAGPAETLQGPDGLFTVSRKLTVEAKTSKMFICRVHQEQINRTRETQVQVSDEFFLEQSNSAVRIIIMVVVSIVPVVAVIFVVTNFGQKKSLKSSADLESAPRERAMEESLELQLLLDGQRDREQSMTANEKKKYLENTDVKLEEELAKTEGELKDVEEVMEILTDQRKNLKTQRDKLISLQQDDRVKVEEIKKKLKTKPKTHTEDKMKKRKKIDDDLKKRTEEHDELLKTTETLLESTDGMINKMTERKGKLEKVKEQIYKLKRENQRQREELEKQEAEQRDGERTKKKNPEEKAQRDDTAGNRQDDEKVQAEQPKADELNPFFGPDGETI